jgi:subtilisin family serine protease
MPLNRQTSLALAALAAFIIAGCTGGGGGSPGGGSGPVPTFTPVPTASPTASGVSPLAYICPTADSTTSIARGVTPQSETVRFPARHGGSDLSAASGLIAVNYERNSAQRSAQSIAQNEGRLGARSVQEYDFAHAGLVTHVLAVDPNQQAQIMNALRGQAGVRGVGATGQRRYAQKVTTPYFPNDPYFTGFTTSGATAPPSTLKVPPYEESANVPGQWDMHAIGLEYAFGYSQVGNGSGLAANAFALGSPSIKIATIDTGQDTGHPELNSKVAYQRCFITNPSNSQSTSAFTTDPDGHGTDVAGIAAEAANNSFGFTGAGGNVVLYAYRVFPSPDTNCASDTLSGGDPQCGSDTRDIAAALNDAVAQHVNVISLSLGGTVCTAGQDPDITEGTAIANAIAANIIVVAAAGNDAPKGLNSPACDPGVIAVGATSLADGTTNGSGRAGGTPAAPIEYVVSYSDFGSPAANPKSATAWGIVAPGGDPGSNTDADDLHWVENIWTSTPGIPAFAGTCTNDYPNSTLTTNPDCRVLIAGTSMSTPHVAGAAALILSVNATYQSPAGMKTLLCTTADDISDAHEGCGRLNVYRAMAKALSDPNPP